MKITHPAVCSDVFKLVDVVEVDLQIADKLIPTRIEVLQNTERKNHFRCHMWELNYFHLETSNLGAARKGKRPPRLASDEPVLVERTWELSSKFHDFVAGSKRAALKRFLDVLTTYLERVSR